MDLEEERSSVWYSTLPDREKLNLYMMKALYPAESQSDRKRVFVLARSLQRAAKIKPTVGAVGMRQAERQHLDGLA